jgi:hypothetical protein
MQSAFCALHPAARESSLQHALPSSHASYHAVKARNGKLTGGGSVAEFLVRICLSIERALLGQGFLSLVVS